MKKKFVYDLNDKKIVKIGNEDLEVFRVVACRDIKNPYCLIKSGEKGGYIAKNTLSQEGESWVDVDSVVGKDCYVSGDSYVVGSLLIHDVRMGNNAGLSYSKINPNKKASIYGDCIVVSSQVDGDLFMSGTARLDDSNVSGVLEMTNDCIIQNCKVESTSSKLTLAGSKKYLEKQIAGFGPISYADSVKIESRYERIL